MFEKFKDKSFWERVKNDPAYQPIIDMILTRYQENKTDPIPVLKYSDYFAYKNKGVREPYEFPYFTRRRYLTSSALLSLIYPENEEYFHDLQEIIFAICGEWAWAVPAHTIDKANQPEEKYTVLDIVGPTRRKRPCKRHNRPPATIRQITAIGCCCDRYFRHETPVFKIFTPPSQM